MSHEAFVELKLGGTTGHVVAFVEGFRLATEFPGPVWYADREGVEADDLIDSLRQKLHRCTHVILERKLAIMIREALSQTTKVHILIESEHEIDSAELPFDFRCYSAEDCGSLKKLVEQDLPEGVVIKGYVTTEEVDEDARGPEMYSPAPHFLAEGKGTYVGPVGGVIEMAHRLTDQSFIHPGKIHLHHPGQGSANDGQ